MAAELAWRAAERVSKGNAAGQQLQGACVVRALGCQHGVDAVVHHGQTQRGHVHAQLVALAGDGLKRVARQAAMHFDWRHVGHFIAYRNELNVMQPFLSLLCTLSEYVPIGVMALL